MRHCAISKPQPGGYVCIESPEFPKLVFVTFPFLVMSWDLPGTRRIMTDCRQEGKLYLIIALHSLA